MLAMERKVGVAPGTTTIALNGDACCPADMARGFPGAAVDLSWMLAPPPENVTRNPLAPQRLLPQPERYVQQLPPPSFVKQAAPIDPAARLSTSPVKAVATRIVQALSPYANFENLTGRRRSGLGLILSPYGDISPEMYSEISATHQNYRNHCGPFDPQYNTQGEAGYYYDSPLGGNMPTDFQVAKMTGYTPVVNSWVPFKEATWTMASWVPPHGGGAYGTIGPPLGRRRGWLDALKSSILGAVDDTPAMPEFDAGRAAVAELQRHQDRMFFISAISTAAVAGGFLLNVIKDRREKNRTRKTPSYENASVPVAGARRRKRKR